MPLTVAASAHSPRRMCISAWLIPNALISMTTCPALGSGSGDVLVNEAVQPAELLEDDGTHDDELSMGCGPSRRSASVGLESAGKEFADRRRDLGSVCFQRKVAGVEEAQRCVGYVALERLRPRRQEERIVLAPYRQERRLVGRK